MTRHEWQDLYQCQLCQSLQCTDFTLLLLYIDTIAHISYFSTSLTSLAASAQLVMQVQARMSQEILAFWSVYVIAFLLKRPPVQPLYNFLDMLNIFFGVWDPAARVLMTIFLQH